MEKYLKHQLNKINKDTPVDQQVYTLNIIYAYLESRGFTTKEIRIAIDKIILEKITEKRKKLNKILKELKGE